jgi:DNA repair protein RadC
MTDEAIIARALVLLEQRARYREPLKDPAAVRNYLRLNMMDAEREHFTCIWLDAQHRVLGFDRLFSGTLTQTSVFPREVVKAALALNSAAVIFAHNHPSGVAEPSSADMLLTENLSRALALVDVRVLDHLIVAGAAITSFAERGLL